MRRLITIDLAGADMEAFETYEAKVLPLLGKYGGRLEMRVRSLDRSCETHLVFYPDAESFERYLTDPLRVAVEGDWQRCGAKSVAVEVEQVADLDGLP